MKDLLYQITTKEMMSTVKRMGYINNFTKVESMAYTHSALGSIHCWVVKSVIFVGVNSGLMVDKVQINI